MGSALPADGGASCHANRLYARLGSRGKCLAILCAGTAVGDNDGHPAARSISEGNLLRGVLTFRRADTIPSSGYELQAALWMNQLRKSSQTLRQSFAVSVTSHVAAVYRVRIREPFEHRVAGRSRGSPLTGAASDLQRSGVRIPETCCAYPSSAGTEIAAGTTSNVATMSFAICPAAYFTPRTRSTVTRAWRSPRLAPTAWSRTVNRAPKKSASGWRSGRRPFRSCAGFSHEG